MIGQNYMHSDMYLEYLIKNCGVQGYDHEEKNPECARSDIDVIMKYVEWLNINNDAVLEIGCGIGRILKEIYQQYHINPSGIDPFDKAINEAKKRVSSICTSLNVASAENTGFEDSSFNKILCWGVFDLTNQSKTLKEMARLLKHNGCVLFTGKGSYYEMGDQEAYLAEKASVKKGIPNHYTNFKDMLSWASQLGLSLQKAYFFKRRGDFVNNIYQEEEPVRFYEYVVLLKRNTMVNLNKLQEPLIAQKHSLTSLEIEK